MYTGPPTTSTTTTITTTTTTQKPLGPLDPLDSLDLCVPKDADPLPAFMYPLPKFVNIIECGSTQYCEPKFGYNLGYLDLFSYLPKS
jgi:hypothetical protein